MAAPTTVIADVGTLGWGLAATLGVIPTQMAPSDEAMAEALAHIGALVEPGLLLLTPWTPLTRRGDTTAAQRVTGMGVAWIDAIGEPRRRVSVGRVDGNSCAVVGYPAAGGGGVAPRQQRFAPACPVITNRRDGPVATPLTGFDLVHALDIPAATPHTLRILRHTTGEHTSWTVVVPGTEEWGIGGDNPFDMDTNLRVVAGLPNAQETAVAEAMKQLNIPDTDPVELVGHSQGGMVVSRLAADPLFTKRFTVTSALCVGAATGGVQPRAGTRMLVVENSRDIVPQLDASARERRRTGVTRVVADVSPAEARTYAPGQVPGSGQHHSRDLYAHLVDQAEHSDNADMRAWVANRRVTMGLNATTRTEAIDFVVRRP
ncbi:hypothetical protein H8R18_08715 [Nanchangia anserum]|nr:hypothetical protein [Nanchangia anserum]QOX81777.1 hypothetical protein H8R18_08715 [Nanchangia anserum]